MGGGAAPCGSHSRSALGGVPPVPGGEIDASVRLRGSDSSEDVVPEQESVVGVEEAVSDGGGEGSGMRKGERLRPRLGGGGGDSVRSITKGARAGLSGHVRET